MIEWAAVGDPYLSRVGASGRGWTLLPSVRLTGGFRITRSPAWTPLSTSTRVPESRFTPTLWISALPSLTTATCIPSRLKIHEFVAPVIRAFAGRPIDRAEQLPAVLPLRVTSERGRTEYLLVSLVRGADNGSLIAYPAGKGSGAVTAFSQADGFIAIGQHVESVAADTPVEVQLIGKAHLADLVVIGSHCVGLDVLIGRLQADGVSVKALNVGSTGGLAAAKRGECDIAPIHLLDAQSGQYNRPFLTPELELLPGYRRLQGIVFRKGDGRFEGRSLGEAIAAALATSDCLMVNRNAGSGTRILTDRLLNGARPPGYWSQPKSHNAVAVAVAQSRADWGVAIEPVAREYNLGFIPVQDEHYDFAIPKARWDWPAAHRFRETLGDAAVRDALAALGFRSEPTARQPSVRAPVGQRSQLRHRLPIRRRSILTLQRRA
jgi:putative molybdopterin biosynthesis protein